MAVILKAEQPLRKIKDSTGATVQGYPRVRLFKAHTRTWQHLDDLHRDLLALQHRPGCALVRGTLTAAGTAAGLVRRVCNQEPYHFEPAAQSWMALDVDGAAVPAPLQSSTPTERAQWLCGEWAPAILRPVSCVVQWTASEGFDPALLYARMWYWITAPITDKALKALVKRWQAIRPALDTSLCSAVQLHYTAPPVIAGGADPRPDRVLRLDRELDAVDLSSELDLTLQLPAPSAPPAPSASGATSQPSAPPPGAHGVEWLRAIAALKRISPDCSYRQWTQIGMALHSQWPVDGLALWHRWSCATTEADHQYRRQQCGQRWATFKPTSGITLATLHLLAKGTQTAHTATRGTVDLQGDLEERALQVLDRIRMENRTSPRTWVQGLSMVRLVQTQKAKEIEVLTADSLRAHLQLTSRFRQWHPETKTKPGQMMPCDLPIALCKQIIHRQKTLPALRRVTRSPRFAPDGTLQTRTGYHRQLETWFELEDLDLQVPGKPTRRECAQALEWLQLELLSEFPFVDECSLVHAVCLLLLPLVRSMIDGPVPLFLVTAPVARTGKSKLVNVCALATTGAQAQLCPPSKDNEEWRKQITATLRSAPVVALIDNLAPGVNTDSANLASLLTAQQWTARELGSSNNLTLTNDAIWTATGNNPALSRELADRCVWIQLDPKHPDPSARSGWRHPRLERWAAQHQGQACSAAATVVRYWMQHQVPGTATMGGFEAWAEVMGSLMQTVAPVMAKEMMKNRAHMRRQVSPAHDEWQTFVHAWWHTHRHQKKNVGELWQLCDKAGLLDTSRGAGNERSQRTRMGRALRGAVDRRYIISDGETQVQLRIAGAGRCSITRSKAYKLEPQQ